MTDLTVYKKYLKIGAIVWAVCLLVFVAAYMVLLKPEAERKRHLDKKLIDTKQELQTARRASEEKTKIELKEQVAQLREKLDTFVIDFENAMDLKFDISQIARKKEVAALSVGNGKKTNTSSNPESDNKSIEEENINISFISGFNEFASFVNSLERHKPVILVHGFNLNRSNKQKFVYQVTLDVRALVKKRNETEIAKLDQ